jgi:predicted  nucleic acid-binding Zn-ribbon protein
MERSFDLLEERVRKAADLVVHLRKENKAIEEDLGRARSRLEEAEKRLGALEKRDRGPEVDGLEKDIAALRKEREEVRSRIGKLVEILEALD